MGRKGSASATVLPRVLLAVFLALASILGAVAANAADLPLAAGSPLVGFTFDDRPLLLPVQRNFQMAMLTAGSEMGRSCGKMEAYGWRMRQSEQQRVDQIFNNTVDRLRGIGYAVESQAPNSISHDITMFTADRADKHFIFMWSAGEIGLVMVLCESTAPITSHSAAGVHLPSVEVLPMGRDVVSSELSTSVQNRSHDEAASKFSPVGQWVGNYVCEQGYTGGTLEIDHLNGENFSGEFRFYPTAKNPLVPKGSYTVSGQYDRTSQRILINPGKWIQRPQGYYNTIIVGSFDPIARTFSAYFQGITGCTSFEAKAATPAKELVAVKKKPVAKKKKPAKKTAPKKPASATAKVTTNKPASLSNAVTSPASSPAASTTSAAAGIVLPAQNAPAPRGGAPAAPSAPVPTAPSAPAPAPVAAPVPSPQSKEVPLTPDVTVPAASVAPTPNVPPSGAPTPIPATTPQSSGASFVPMPSVSAGVAASAPLATPALPSVSPPALAPATSATALPLVTTSSPATAPAH